MDEKVIKKNHHFIWAYYLGAWEGENKKLFYTTKKLKIDSLSASSIAKEKRFYNIRSLNHEDIALVNAFIDNNTSIKLKPIFNGYLNKFIEISEELSRLKSKGNECEASAKQFDLITCNSLEDIHTVFENHAKPILIELRNGNLNILSNKILRSMFFQYLGLQFYRTKHVRDFIKDFSLAPDHIINMQNEIEIFKRCWWFLSLISGIEMGFNLLLNSEGRNIQIVDNHTSTSFITGEKPICKIPSNDNLLNTSGEKGLREFVYPLSPKRLFIVSDKKIYDMPEDRVERTNLIIAAGSDGYIYGDSIKIVEAVLEKYRQHKSKT